MRVIIPIQNYWRNMRGQPPTKRKGLPSAIRNSHLGIYSFEDEEEILKC